MDECNFIIERRNDEGVFELVLTDDEDTFANEREAVEEADTVEAVTVMAEKESAEQQRAVKEEHCVAAEVKEEHCKAAEVKDEMEESELLQEEEDSEIQITGQGRGFCAGNYTTAQRATKED